MDGFNDMRKSLYAAVEGAKKRNNGATYTIVVTHDERDALLTLLEPSEASAEEE